MFCCWQERARPASLRLRGGTRPEGAARSGSPALPGGCRARGRSCFNPYKAPHEKV